MRAIKRIPKVDRIDLLSRPPFSLNKELSEVLADHPDLLKKLAMFNPEELKAGSEQEFDSFSRRIDGLLQGRSLTARSSWTDFKRIVKEGYKYGTSGPVETIAAMILAGAVINKSVPGPLRVLSPTLTAAQNVSNTDHVHLFAQAYKSLNLESGGILKNKIDAILSETQRPLNLKLGKELNDLDINKIEELRKKYFGGIKKFSGIGNRQGPILKKNWIPNKDEYPDIELSAPKKVTMKLKSLKCNRTLDDNKDEVYAIAYFSHITNLENVYDQINNAIQNDTWDETKLDISQKTDISLTEKVDFSNNTTHIFNQELGAVNLIQGFGPYHSCTVIYENDDEEYTAVSDVLDKITEYATYVERGAVVSAAVLSPTIIGSGIAAVALLADSVKICSSIGSAIVKIVNLLDQDDCIGSGTFNSVSDFVNVAPTSSHPFPTVHFKNYELMCEEFREGSEQITRNWEFMFTNGEDKKHKFTAGFIPGIREDKQSFFDMNQTTHKLILSDVDICDSPGPGRGHSEWKSRWPVVIEKLKVQGLFHVGMSGYGSIEVRPWATGIKVTRTI